MSTRTLRSVLASMLLAAAMLFTAASYNASAQPQVLTCCTFTVDVSGLPLTCFPITLITDWCPTGQHTFTAPANGIYVLPVPGSCPPFAPYFLTAAIPSGPAVPLGSSGTAVVGGCTVTYTAATDPSGCIYITIR